MKRTLKKSPPLAGLCLKKLLHLVREFAAHAQSDYVWRIPAFALSLRNAALQSVIDHYLVHGHGVSPFSLSEGLRKTGESYR